MKIFSFKKVKEKYVSTSPESLLVRRIKNWFNHKLLPFFIKIFAALITFLVVLLVLLKLFKPIYLDKLYQKTSFYFFHYLNLDNQNFSVIKISGNNRAKTSDIENVVYRVAKEFKMRESVKDFNEEYEPLIKQLIVEIKKDLPWINKIVITRSMPHTINIAVTEYEPFAIWQDEGQKYVTDKDGNIVLVDDIEEFKHLVILSGKDANIHANSLFNIFAIDPDLSQKIYSATWLGGRRWDIRLDNGLLIKLPEDNISEAWHSLIKIYSMPGSINDLKIIDLRIAGKVYLEYGDFVIKELKSL